MMFLLAGDVAADCFPAGRADAECAITFLPCKSPVAGSLMNPFRGNRFDVANHIGETGSRGEAKEEMDMIRHAADGFGNTT